MVENMYHHHYFNNTTIIIILIHHHHHRRSPHIDDMAGATSVLAHEDHTIVTDGEDAT